jgi:GcrA cell cycle regulator
MAWHRGSVWTPERLDELRALTLQGLTANEIAITLGCGITRNAVIGVMARRGILSTNKPINPGNVRQRAEARARTIIPKSPPPPPVVEIAPFLKEDGRHIGLLDLSSKTCHWPIGDPQAADFHYCGNAPRSGKPYCAFHQQMAYQRPSPRRANLEEAVG